MEQMSRKYYEKALYEGYRKPAAPTGSAGDSRQKGKIIPIRGRMLRNYPHAHG